jgi:hypothetical protein
MRLHSGQVKDEFHMTFKCPFYAPVLQRSSMLYEPFGGRPRRGAVMLCSVLQRHSVAVLLLAHCCALCPACMAAASAFGRLQRCWALQYVLCTQVAGTGITAQPQAVFSVHVAVCLARRLAVRQESHLYCKTHHCMLWWSRRYGCFCVCSSSAMRVQAMPQ